MRSPATGRRAWKWAAPISTPSPSTCSGCLEKCGHCCARRSNRASQSPKARARKRRSYSEAGSVFRDDRTSLVEAIIHANQDLLAAKPQRNSIGQSTSGAESPCRIRQPRRIELDALGAEIQIVVFAEQGPAARELPFETSADRVASPRETRGLSGHRTGSHR